MAEYDVGSQYDPFGGDVPTYEDVLNLVLLEERKEADKTAKAKGVTPTKVAERSEHPPSRRDKPYFVR